LKRNGLQVKQNLVGGPRICGDGQIILEIRCWGVSSYRKEKFGGETQELESHCKNVGEKQKGDDEGRTKFLKS